MQVLPNCCLLALALSYASSDMQNTEKNKYRATKRIFRHTNRLYPHRQSGRITLYSLTSLTTRMGPKLCNPMGTSCQQVCTIQLWRECNPWICKLVIKNAIMGNGCPHYSCGTWLITFSNTQGQEICPGNVSVTT